MGNLALSRKSAIAMAESNWWEGKTAQEICRFQLFETRLCMPFELYHKAVEEALGRPVWTHEFGSAGLAGLQKEFLGDKEAPTMAEIIELIPEAKRILVTI